MVDFLMAMLVLGRVVFQKSHVQVLWIETVSLQGGEGLEAPVGGETFSVETPVASLVQVRRGSSHGVSISAL